MSDYGADPSPDLFQLQVLAGMYGFTDLQNVKCDRYTVDADLIVVRIVQKGPHNRLLLAVDPTLLPHSP
jgi:hypothetical protein